ncbi:MAG: hypothetical protein Q9222_003893 [Ikaeria aurantiellina]
MPAIRLPDANEVAHYWYTFSAAWFEEDVFSLDSTRLREFGKRCPNNMKILARQHGPRAAKAKRICELLMKKGLPPAESSTGQALSTLVHRMTASSRSPASSAIGCALTAFAMLPVTYLAWRGTAPIRRKVTQEAGRWKVNWRRERKVVSRQTKFRLVSRQQKNPEGKAAKVKGDRQKTTTEGRDIEETANKDKKKPANVEKKGWENKDKDVEESEEDEEDMEDEEDEEDQENEDQEAEEGQEDERAGEEDDDKEEDKKKQEKKKKKKKQEKFECENIQEQKEDKEQQDTEQIDEGNEDWEGLEEDQDPSTPEERRSTASKTSARQDNRSMLRFIQPPLRRSTTGHPRNQPSSFLDKTHWWFTPSLSVQGLLAVNSPTVTYAAMLAPLLPVMAASSVDTVRLLGLLKDIKRTLEAPDSSPSPH